MDKYAALAQLAEHHWVSAEEYKVIRTAMEAMGEDGPAKRPSKSLNELHGTAPAELDGVVFAFSDSSVEGIVKDFSHPRGQQRCSTCHKFRKKHICSKIPCPSKAVCGVAKLHPPGKKKSKAKSRGSGRAKEKSKGKGKKDNKGKSSSKAASSSSSKKRETSSSGSQTGKGKGKGKETQQHAAAAIKPIAFTPPSTIATTASTTIPPATTTATTAPTSSTTTSSGLPSTSTMPPPPPPVAMALEHSALGLPPAGLSPPRTPSRHLRMDMGMGELGMDMRLGVDMGLVPMGLGMGDLELGDHLMFTLTSPGSDMLLLTPPPSSSSFRGVQTRSSTKKRRRMLLASIEKERKTSTTTTTTSSSSASSSGSSNRPKHLQFDDPVPYPDFLLQADDE